MFHHIGIFVKNIESGKKHLANITQISKVSDLIIDENIGVKIVFIEDKDKITYELVAPYGKNNPVSNVLKSRKNILNHLAFTTNQFEQDILKLRNKGFVPIGKPQPAKAFKGARVVFFLTPLGFIYELIEAAT